MENLIFTQLDKLEFEELIKKAVATALSDLSDQPQTQPQPQSNLIDIDTFRSLLPKKLAKPTVYSQISKHQIPNFLIYKPKGVKQILFHKDLVLQWITDGMLNEAEQTASDYVHNRK